MRCPDCTKFVSHELSDDTELRLADQPSWPLEYALASELAWGLAEEGDVEDHFHILEAEGTSDDWAACNKCGKTFLAGDALGMLMHVRDLHDVEVVAYLATANQLGYLRAGISDQLGWR